MIEPLPADALRWTLDPARFSFETTEEVEPIDSVIGQEHALEALHFGIESVGPGQNIYIRGLTGTGRMRVVREMLEQLRPSCPALNDRCYVHNFAAPESPRLITLHAGTARTFRRMVNDFADFIRDELHDELASDALKARREALERRSARELDKVTKPFEEALKAADLALVSMQGGLVPQTAIFPLFEGKPVPPEEFEQLQAQGKITEAQHALFEQRRESFGKKLEGVTESVRKIRRQHMMAVRAVVEEAARADLGERAREILAEFPGEDVARFLSEVIDDVAENHLEPPSEKSGDVTQIYRVNIVQKHETTDDCPIIVENAPTLTNLLGTVGREIGPGGVSRSDHTMISAGSILRADGGYLILEINELLRDTGAWRVLMRTLRTGRLDIVPSELFVPWMPQTLKPDPVDINVKVLLIGDTQTYLLLDRYDPDFSNLFKVLADFDSVLPRSDEIIDKAPGSLARFIREENLRHFDPGGVAALVEHAARIASTRNKITARFGRIADLAREASFLAAKESVDTVTSDQVLEAIRRSKHRADLPSRRFREYLADGTIQVQTRGETVGQINGLAVMQSGPLTYGFPARITATIGAGTAGVINIEREAALSGSIHTKGFYILGGLLRHLLQTDHPLAFSASVAFEQSYGGIDGDSASGAEICCLLSALTDVPIRQCLAMTGAIDQMGNILAIGGVNEKIEGFFDTCTDAGLTGDQGVIIPTANAADLMLRHDVVAACREDRFHIYTVNSVQQAIETLTGVPAGDRDEETEEYPEESVLGQAVERAYEFWQMAARTPASVTMPLEEGEEEEEEEQDEEEIAAADE